MGHGNRGVGVFVMFFYCGESHSSRCASGLLRYPYVLLSPSATKSDLFFHFPQFPNRQRAFTYPFSSSPHFHFHTRSSLPSPSPFYCRPSPFPQLLIFLDFSQRTSNSNRNAKAAPHRSPPPEHAAGSSRELQSHLFSLTKIISQLFLVSDLVLLSHLFCSLHPIPSNPSQASLLSNNNNIHAPPCLLLFFI